MRIPVGYALPTVAPLSGMNLPVGTGVGKRWMIPYISVHRLRSRTMLPDSLANDFLMSKKIMREYSTSRSGVTFRHEMFSVDTIPWFENPRLISFNATRWVQVDFLWRSYFRFMGP
jgi:hypothetical protein